MTDAPALEGRRVLVVEDETMIALLVEDMLADLGCQVVGPAHRLSQALELVDGGHAFDVALLDVNLGGEPVFPVADALRARGVPAIFSTGYGDAALRDIDRGAPVLQKPYYLNDLRNALGEALRGI